MPALLLGSTTAHRQRDGQAVPRIQMQVRRCCRCPQRKEEEVERQSLTAGFHSRCTCAFVAGK